MSSTLDRHFPGTASLPRARIADLPTPVERIEAPRLAVGRLSVKRDDLTSRAYGGNKVRKLQFFLGRALAEQRRTVVTFGAYGSNHALATAVHARALGIEPHAILTPQVPTPYARATVLAHAGLGTVLHPVEGQDGSREAERLRAELRARDGCEPLVIPLGGSSALGALGFVDAALELAEQARPDVVYLAGGTLGSAVGLAVGFAAAGASTRIVAARVTPATVANEAILARLASDTVELLRHHETSFPALDRGDLAFELCEGFYEPGYAAVTPAATSAVALARELGVTLETTYTGRAFAALLADAAGGALEDADVLFWHTYNSAPMPPPGREASLPSALRDFIAACG
jgi:1-aminocyclopropane-1-carboxylate deaminase/D-cysteine desulfhydrase-like pyridoxal-dependent ACC family enzyme